MAQSNPRPALVLIHGWGLDSQVWRPLLPLLESHFDVQCLDLPGYGQHQQVSADNLLDLASHLLKLSPSAAYWLGWSLGGLVATQAALLEPTRCLGLITVAHSPRFTANDDWQGVAPSILAQFIADLEHNPSATLARFVGLQALGSLTARQDVKQLRAAIQNQTMPDHQALTLGLELLARCDLRSQLAQLQPPWLRLYGQHDTLVPACSVVATDQLAPQSQRQVFAHASHAPFISEAEAFVKQLKQFVNE
ncbi:Pimeloyl-[acyl-carrier protein] methyl ester esterase [Vibrio stylophorae]|uniref:Pimeloyl-[acyl-carrier protein] methyl ester esterase n=1 Tax=Vibrio stylophorae TaxID=659351 RepID=A0ABN8DV43_9VIBR|nr:pimeloyl-ACP methyl ester esterase BioH [Vibrio stylophorae]CAH0534647.1 Pimeloyl-[acyl-carrier protein] methyl ester esterase [Vibrio stylophorae]